MPGFFDDFDPAEVQREADISSREFNIYTFSGYLLNAMGTISTSPSLKEPHRMYVGEDGNLYTLSSIDIQSGAFEEARRRYNREMAEFISEGIGLFNQYGAIYSGIVQDATEAELEEGEAIHQSTAGAGARSGGIPWDGAPSGGSQSSGGGAGGGGGNGGGGGGGAGGAAGGGGGGGGGGPSTQGGIGVPGSVPPVAQFVAGVATLAVGLMSQRVSGPIEVGDPDSDKHDVGEDRDGNPIRSAHLSVFTNFWRDREFDAPLMFENKVERNESWPRFIVRAHIRYDEQLEHPFVLGPRGGYWRIQARCHHTHPDVPPEPPDTVPHHHFDAPKPWATGGPPDYPVTTPNMHMAPGYLYRPQPLGDGWAEFRNTAVNHPHDQWKLDKYAPVVARVEGYVAQVGNEFLYTARPGESRHIGGTAPGGLVYLPPEVDITDHETNFAPGGRTLSTVHHVCVPGVYQAAAYPDVATGGVKTGYRWGGDSAGKLMFQRVSGAGAATDVMGMSVDGAVLLKELAADPATPAGTFWGFYFKSDGLYHIDDAGTVTGPLVDTVGGGGYTDEEAQDAVGGILTDSSDLDFTYDDATPTITAIIKDGAVTNTLMDDMADATIKGRALGAGSGAPQDLTAAQAAAIIRPAPLTTEAHTSDDTLTAAESGSHHTNKGAGGAVNIDLPAAAAGLHFYFTIHAAQVLRVRVAAGDNILVTGVSGTTQAAASTAGHALHLMCLDGSDWVANSVVGTWSVT